MREHRSAVLGLIRYEVTGHHKQASCKNRGVSADAKQTGKQRQQNVGRTGRSAVLM